MGPQKEVVAHVPAEYSKKVAELGFAPVTSMELHRLPRLGNMLVSSFWIPRNRIKELAQHSIKAFFPLHPAK